MPVDVTLAPGIYEARFEVLGDATVTVSYLWILPTGSHIAVTDIDGTLTTSDTELFVQILLNSYVPTAYPSAAELTTAHAAKRHVVAYITGRPTSRRSRSTTAPAPPSSSTARTRWCARA